MTMDDDDNNYWRCGRHTFKKTRKHASTLDFLLLPKI